MEFLEDIYSLISIREDDDADAQHALKDMVEKIVAADGKFIGSSGDTPLHWSTRANKYNMLDTLLRSGAAGAIDIQDKGGVTPLLSAVKEGSVECARLLLRNGADPELGDVGKKMPIHVASQSGDSSILFSLIEAEVSLSSRTTNGNLPLHVASAYGQLAAVRILIRAGADACATNDTGDTALHLAADNGYLEICELLLSRKVPVSAKNKSKKRAEGLAKKSGHKEIVALLAHYEKLKIKATTVMTAVRDKSFPDAKLDTMFKGIPLGVVDQGGKTALHHCVQAGNIERMKLLIAKGVPVNRGDYSGETPLEMAVKAKRDDIATELVGRGADVNFCIVPRGATVLHLAVANNSETMIRLLLETATPETVNLADGSKATPLHVAVKNRSFDLVKLLLAGGANTRLKNDQGLSPVDLAKKMQFNELEELLDKESSVVDETYKLLQAVCDNDGSYIKTLLRKYDTETLLQVKKFFPLHLAANLGHLEAVQALLSRVDFIHVDTFDDREMTPLCRAAEGGHLDVIKFLLSKKAKVCFDCPPDISPVHVAAAFGHCDVIRFLLTQETGLDVNVKTKDDENITAIIAAVRMQEKEAASLLLSFGADPTNCWQEAERTKNEELLAMFKGKKAVESQKAVEDDDEEVAGKVVEDKAMTKLIQSNTLEIVLSNKELKSVPDAVFECETTCKLLDLSGNSLDIVSPKIKRLLYLEALSVAHNKLRRLPQALALCLSLRVIDISHNRIRWLPSDIGKLQKLEELKANDNVLADLPHSLGDIKSLTVLQLENNKINALPAGLGDCANLKRINVDGNREILFPPRRLCKEGTESIKSYLRDNKESDPTKNAEGSSATNRPGRRKSRAGNEGRMSTLRKITSTFR